MAQAHSIPERASTIISPILVDIGFALPSTITKDRFKTVFMTAAMQNPDILSGDGATLRNELIKCANDGLLPDGRQAAMIMFKGKAKYMPMVQGMLSRARELGELFSVTAECVYERDVFDADRSNPAQTSHKSPPLSEDRGKIIGAYAIFRDDSGHVMHREIMDRGQLDKIKSKSLTTKGGVWAEWESEMCRKSVIKRGLKYVPISPSFRTMATRDDDMTDITPSVVPTQNPLLPPVEIPEATLQDRLIHALSLCSTSSELDHVAEMYDAEILEADPASQEAVRLLLNAKGLQVEKQAAYVAAVISELEASEDMPSMVSVATSHKSALEALPDNITNPVYELYKTKRDGFTKARSSDATQAGNAV